MITVEYSKSGRCFHIDTLANVISQNRDLFDRDYSTDYHIIAVFNDDEYDEALAFAKKHDKRLHPERYR